MGTTITARPRRASRALAALCAFGLVAAACSDDGTGGGDAATTTAGTEAPTGVPEALAGLPEADESIQVLESTQTFAVTGLEPAEPVTLHDTEGTALLTMLATDDGLTGFAYVPDEHITVDAREMKTPPTAEGGSLKPGTYWLTIGEGDDASVRGPVTVHAVDDVPDQAFFDAQELVGVELPIIGDAPEGVSGEDGYNYIEMRDGILLSATIRFPDSRVYGEAPYPAVIEMEGYSGSNPGSEPPGSRIARSFGFATVAVNIRGTGCSGGAFDVFNPAQQADAYDVVEAVAAQDWVKGNQVGVLGLSYSGIMTMYAGAMNPPHLAAIVPQSVIPDPWGQQWPGGIYNAGFTKQWLDERDRQSAVGGSNWVNDRIEAGTDEVCADNLALRSLNIDFEAFGRLLENRPQDEDERDLRLLAENVHVPTLLTGAFQDEQTGPFWTELIPSFTNAPLLRVNMWNGRHPDGYTPMNIMDWYEFLQLYVNEEVPNLPEIVIAGAGPEFASNFELEDVTLRGNRLFEEFGDDYEAALAAYEAEDPIRVVLESGFGENEVGEPGGTVELHFPSWPVPDTETQEWFLAPGEALAEDAPTVRSEETYQHDPEGLGLDFFTDGYHLFQKLWDFDWTTFPEGRSLSYLTAPLDEDVVLAGPSQLKVWIGSEADDVDVQVVLSEVRPDGVEYQLQNGYLRVGHRFVDEERSDGLQVVHPLTAEAYAPIPEGELVEARIVLPAVFAPVRAGSQLRIQISTPGRSHGTWLFESPYGEGEEPTHRVALGGDDASSFSTTLLRGIELPAELPPCPALRGQACREFTPTTNAAG